MKCTRILATLILLISVLTLVAVCGCDDDDDDDDNDDIAGDDDDDNDTAGDDDDDDTSGATPQVRLSAYDSAGDFFVTAFRDGDWHAENVDAGGAIGLMFADSHPDYANAWESVGEYIEPKAIVHFDGDTWRKETIDGDFIYVGPVAFHDGLGLAIAGVESGGDEDCRDIIAHDADGWSPESLPAITFDYYLFEGPVFDNNGDAFVLGQDTSDDESGEDFILKRGESGWQIETLPTISDDWWFNYSFNPQISVSPEGQVWVRGCDAENDETFLLTQDGKGWGKENLPEVGEHWRINDIAFCPDGTMFAVGEEDETESGLILKKDGTWAQESFEYAADEWEFAEVYCTPGNLAFAVATVDLDDSYDTFLASNRSGAWVEEELPLSDARVRFSGVLGMDDGRVFVWGEQFVSEDVRAPFFLTLDEGAWLVADLSFLPDGDTRWGMMFMEEDIMVDSDGELWAGVATLNQTSVLNFYGDSWTDLTPGGEPLMGWDLITY
ncbi:MAG: hypothetical protein P9L99_07665 [Candidatus Lernaella stagnicola]|nr:hypothetical protein [Candidatus Lernaella stagnicola]